MVHGAMVPWRAGANYTNPSLDVWVLWCHGVRCIRAMVHGDMVLWFHGAMVPWCLSSMVHGAMVPWFHGARSAFVHGVMVPCGD
ncbi:hypothetical protein T459_16129 [Capsicum annuum]|uniref:Uncharacterized protein n=1 Tax=Capsicum annuum TaxID=4072 RepID=A0A2G2Z7U5_CAPAN|nr:hypothetical protein T459_16129 [Capsicum annuum]